jgi:hypothetical protein
MSKIQLNFITEHKFEKLNNKINQVFAFHSKKLEVVCCESRQS